MTSVVLWALELKTWPLGFLLPSLNLLASWLLGDLSAMLLLVSLKVFKFKIFSLVCLQRVLWYCGKCLLFLLGLWARNEGLQTANRLEPVCTRGRLLSQGNAWASVTCRPWWISLRKHLPKNRDLHRFSLPGSKWASDKQSHPWHNLNYCLKLCHCSIQWSSLSEHWVHVGQAV